MRMLKTMISRKGAYRALIAGLFVVCSVSLFVAAVKYGDAGGGTKAFDEANHDAGNFWLTINNVMYLAGDGVEMGGEWPGGSGIEYMYRGEFWVGTMDVGGNIFVSNTFYTNNEWVESGGVSSGSVLMSNESNWAGRPAGVEQISDLDSFIEVFDDAASENGPIGLRVYRHGYQWSAPGHDEWIIFEYTVFNDSGASLPDVYVAMPFDNDVGGSLDYIDDLVLFEGNDATDVWENPTDPGEPWTVPGGDGIPDENDYVNFDEDNGYPLGKPRMMSVMYDSGDENRDVPGYIGCRIIDCTLSSDPPDSEGLRPIYEVSAQHSWDIQNDPASDINRYGYMLDTGTFEEITTPYDWRMCQSWGPFDPVPAEATIHWWAGIVMGADLNDMRKNADALYADYLGPDGVPGTEDDWFVVSPPTAPRLVAVKGNSTVTLRWNPEYELGRNTETDPDSRTGFVDFDGYVIWKSSVGFDIGWEPVIWVDKATNNAEAFEPWGWRAGERIPDGSGSFTEPDLTGSTRVAYEDVRGGTSTVVDYNNAGGYYGWTDTSVVNGTRYYYAVTPYDFGSVSLDDVTPVIAGRNSNALYSTPIMSASSSLDNVTVVPNPYRGSADWEEWTPSGIRLGKIWFMNLPKECTITIYTISGDPVRILEHRSNEIGAEAWDLTGGSGVQVASGVYVYQVEAGDETKIGKFAVIVGQN